MNGYIYQIRNIVNDKIYIGQTINLPKRFHMHIWMLKNNKHDNKHLQSAWNLYGEDKFKFELIEKCEESELIKREQYYVDTRMAYLDTHGYNIAKCVNNPMLGETHSKNTRKKISNAHKGMLPSIESRKKMSQNNAWRGKHSPMLGRKQSNETKLKLRKHMPIRNS